tara:strand:- start:2614 stop:2835 length:222 start_codon:yes stop_codon:yes gene_type:complete
MNPECINCCNKEEKERYRETVDIQHLQIEYLTDCIQRIGDIIYFEMDITEQDWWLDDMVNSGNYTPTKGTEND